MKKTISIALAGISFIVEEDAYQVLDNYLEAFRAGMPEREAAEVMEDVEQRIAELFTEQIKSPAQVVTLPLVEQVIDRLGYPNEGRAQGAKTRRSQTVVDEPVRKRLYRDPDNVAIGGVCSGLAAYFNLDVIIIRLIFVILLLAGSLGLPIYLVMWIAVPKARTVAQKLEMRGLAPTAENIRRYASRSK